MAFEITDHMGTTHYFAVSSEKERSEWLEALGKSMYSGPSDEHGPTSKEVNSIMEGWLEKTGSRGPEKDKWHPRFFVLTEQSLKYYKKKMDVKEAGAIPLTGGSGVVQKLFDPRWPFMFTVSTAANGYSRCFYLAAKDDEERELWLNSLATVKGISTIGLGAKQQEVAKKKGYLLKQVVGGKKFKKQWIVLLADRLLLLKSEQDQTPEGVILLPPGGQVNVLYGTPDAFSVASSADDGEILHVFRAKGIEEMDDWVREISAVLPRGELKVSSNSLREQYLHVKETEGAMAAVGPSSLVSRWRKVYVVLLPTGVRYFRKKTDAIPACMVLLDGAAVITPVSGSGSGDNNSFLLYPSGDEGEKPYEFKAEFTTVRDTWLKLLREVNTKNYKPLHQNSLKEGYLEKTGSDALVWHRRFFVLFPDRLVYYKKRRAREPAGKVSLSGASRCVLYSH